MRADVARADLKRNTRLFATFGDGLSSHAYSNDPGECRSLQENGWTLEVANAFYVLSSPTGSCPAGTIPLYRVYNNAVRGAPNHRYTTDTTMRQATLANRWSPSGNGALGVFGCVPQ